MSSEGKWHWMSRTAEQVSTADPGSRLGGDLTVQKEEVEVLELELNGGYRGEDEAEYKANEC